MIHPATFQRCFDTVWGIASSRYVKWFVIGYTAQSATERFRGYQQRGFHYLVILADKLTRVDALTLEEWLQDECKYGKAVGEPYRRKYHPEFRPDCYRRSAGPGTRCKPHERLHSVYMVWVDPSA